jgi:hypothetical protein
MEGELFRGTHLQWRAMGQWFRGYMHLVDHVRQSRRAGDMRLLTLAEGFDLGGSWVHAGEGKRRTKHGLRARYPSTVSRLGGRELAGGFFPLERGETALPLSDSPLDSSCSKMSSVSWESLAASRHN